MSAPSHPRVVLADDYEPLITALTRVLRPGCEVVGRVTDGPAAIDAAVQLQPDVVVIDVHLPLIDGLEVCRRILRADPRIKVIVISASSDPYLEQMALEAGASAFLMKAVAGTELLAAIERALATPSD